MFLMPGSLAVGTSVVTTQVWQEERRRVRAGHAVTSSNKGERVYNKDRPDVHVYRPGRGGGKPSVPEHGTITIQQRPTSAPTNKTVVPPANKSAVEEMPSAKQSTPRGKGSASRVRAGRGRGAPALQGQQVIMPMHFHS